MKILIRMLIARVDLCKEIIPRGEKNLKKLKNGLPWFFPPDCVWAKLSKTCKYRIAYFRQICQFRIVSHISGKLPQQRIAATWSSLAKTNGGSVARAQSTEWLTPQGSGSELRWLPFVWWRKNILLERSGLGKCIDFQRQCWQYLNNHIIYTPGVQCCLLHFASPFTDAPPRQETLKDWDPPPFHLLHLIPG